MHRVLNMTSTGINETEISDLKTIIKNEIANYSTHEYEVNDGHDMEDNPTLAVNADFDSATDSNSFNSYLQQLITKNSDKFSQCRIRVHDCFHAAGENLPCKIGDVWRL